MPSNLKMHVGAQGEHDAGDDRAVEQVADEAPRWPWPPTGANSVASRVLPLKYWMEVVLACSTLRKMAPKPRDEADTMVLLVGRWRRRT